MACFEVWAPKAKKMELYLKDQRMLMEAGEHGWWSLEAPEAGPGSDYGFCIDGEGPYPDPRSFWQPNGVHGLSRLVSPEVFRPRKGPGEHFQARPLASGVVYELHVGTFTPDGTFDSAILRLDDLVNLGVTHIELMPVAEFPGNYGWGYDGVDLYAPHHAYGGPEGLRRLVDACHARGLGVILDVVYNHLGPDGNYLDKFGPYHSETDSTAWGAAMNFDGPGSDEVRRFFIDNARMWLRDYHIDGLRLDAVHAIIDNGARHFLEALHESICQLELEIGRHLVVTAESDLNDPRMVRPTELGGYGLNAQWSDDFHHALHVLLTGEQSGYYVDFVPWDDLERALTQVFVYNGRYSSLRGRRHGRPVGKTPAYRFLGYIQNHDQVGNRAQGERIGQLVGPDLAKVAAALVLTAPFVPMLFMGEEWDASTPFQYFTDHEKGLGKMVSEGRRNEFVGFGWKPEEVPDPQEYQTFMNSKLNWDERGFSPHAEVLDWYRRLIELRRCSPTLTDGRMEDVGVQFDRVAGWLVMNRGPFVIACNLAEREEEVPLRHSTAAKAVLASRTGAQLTERGAQLPPQSVLIFEDPFS